MPAKVSPADVWGRLPLASPPASAAGITARAASPNVTRSVLRVEAGDIVVFMVVDSADAAMVPSKSSANELPVADSVLEASVRESASP